jgi:hypothetical protein
MDLSALKTKIEANAEKIPAEVAGAAHTFMAYVESEYQRFMNMIEGHVNAVPKVVAPEGAPESIAKTVETVSYGDPVQTPVPGAADIAIPAAHPATPSPTGAAVPVQAVGSNIAVNGAPTSAVVTESTSFADPVGTKTIEPAIDAASSNGQAISVEEAEAIKIREDAEKAKLV